METNKIISQRPLSGEQQKKDLIERADAWPGCEMDGWTQIREGDPTSNRDSSVCGEMKGERTKGLLGSWGSLGTCPQLQLRARVEGRTFNKRAAKGLAPWSSSPGRCKKCGKELM